MKGDDPTEYDLRYEAQARDREARRERNGCQQGEDCKGPNNDCPGLCGTMTPTLRQGRFKSPSPKPERISLETVEKPILPWGRLGPYDFLIRGEPIPHHPRPGELDHPVVAKKEVSPAPSTANLSVKRSPVKTPVNSKKRTYDQSNSKPDTPGMKRLKLIKNNQAKKQAMNGFRRAHPETNAFLEARRRDQEQYAAERAANIAKRRVASDERRMEAMEYGVFNDEDVAELGLIEYSQRREEERANPSIFNPPRNPSKIPKDVARPGKRWY